MSENQSATDWAGTRGEKWLAQLSGLEATLKPIDAPLIRALSLTQACVIADIGCGGGGTTVELKRAAPTGSVVHGYDLSPKLVAHARQRAAGLTDITFEVADLSAAAPPRLHQRLVSRFGTMFFDDPTRAFANIARWLAPEGQIAFAVWGPAADNPWFTSVRDAAETEIALPPADPDAPGAFRYGDVTRLLRLLQAAGFDKLDVMQWRDSLAIGGGLPPEQAARFALASYSSFDELLSAAGEGAYARAREVLTARLSAHVVDGVVRLPALVHIVTAVRLGH